MHEKVVTATLSATTLEVCIEGQSPTTQAMTEPLPVRLALSGFNGTIFELLPPILPVGGAAIGGASTVPTANASSRAHRMVNNKCMVCTLCSACTGFGRGCCRHGSKDRSGDKGQECGCGGGDSGCGDCGMCKSCCSSRSVCPGVKGDHSATQAAVQKSNKVANIIRNFTFSKYPS